jgi:precorrin-3B methylase
VLTILAVVDLIRPLVADVSAVAAIVESRISPQIAAVESAFARVGAPLSQLQS